MCVYACICVCVRICGSLVVRSKCVYCYALRCSLIQHFGDFHAFILCEQTTETSNNDQNKLLCSKLFQKWSEKPQNTNKNINNQKWILEMLEMWIDVSYCIVKFRPEVLMPRRHVALPPPFLPQFKIRFTGQTTDLNRFHVYKELSFSIG